MLIRLINRLQGHKRQSQFPPIDGARTLIESLSARYRLAIVSTRSKSEASTFLTQTGIDGNLEAIVGRDSTWRIKPHPQPLLSAAQLLGVPIERCLMVGDTTVDMRAARRAGAWAVGVLCGFGQRPELERAGAHVILEHTRQLTDLL